MIIRVRGLLDDKIRIILSTTEGTIENLLPASRGHYTYRTWRNSRHHIIRKMLKCLFRYYMYGDFQRIIRLVSKPLRVQKLGCVMGEILDLQKRYILRNFKELEHDEAEISL